MLEKYPNDAMFEGMECFQLGPGRADDADSASECVSNAGEEPDDDHDEPLGSLDQLAALSEADKHECKGEGHEAVAHFAPPLPDSGRLHIVQANKKMCH